MFQIFLNFNTVDKILVTNDLKKYAFTSRVSFVNKYAEIDIVLQNL